MPMDVSRLQVTVEEGERWRRTLSITVPQDLVQAERQAALRKLSSQIQLPGFRKGRIPAAIVEKRFGGAVTQELVDRVVGEAYRAVLQEKDLRPISEGEVSKVEFADETDLTFHVGFDVSPQITLAHTTGFAVERPQYTVGDNEVEQVLERVREQHGTWVPTEEGKPEVGDQVHVRIQRLAVEGDEPRPYQFVLGKNEAIPDVESAIQTLEVGGEGTFTVTFPDDFPTEARRGESDELRIFLDARKRMELPELTDELAKQVGPFETVQELRARVREDLEKEAGQEVEAAIRAQLLQRLVEANPFDLPVSMIDQYIQSMIGEERKLTPEQRIEARAQLGEEAELAVKRYLVVESYAVQKGLHATSEELDARIEEMAERAGTNPGELYVRLEKAGRLERLEAEITENKVFDALKADSTITEAA
jgi:trigger factor